MFYLLGVASDQKVHIISHSHYHSIVDATRKSGQYNVGTGPNDWRKLIIVSDVFVVLDDKAVSDKNIVQI